jgi:hypothetical protein
MSLKFNKKNNWCWHVVFDEQAEECVSCGGYFGLKINFRPLQNTAQGALKTVQMTKIVSRPLKLAIIANEYEVKAISNLIRFRM